MVEDAFETEVAGLFAHADSFDDSNAFAEKVSDRVARLRRASRLVHGAAFTVGGAIALLELSQASLWTWLGQAAQRAGAAFNTEVAPSAQALLTPTPMFCAGVLGAALLIAYLSTVWRET
jgi:hypothetical protein